MARTSPEIKVEEIPGNKHKSLDDAWKFKEYGGKSAREMLVDMLVKTAKELEDKRYLILENGRLVPNPNPNIEKIPIVAEEKQISIYALVDPRTNDVRYIGQAGNPKQRLDNHKYGPKRKLFTWINELRAEGLYPRMDILEVVPKDIANETEIKHIRDFSKSGKLLNIQSILTS